MGNLSKPAVSIIIPAFNVEYTLQDTIDSVINQTFKNIEIIIINDGSVDGTWTLINKLAKYDKRIIAINQKNCGSPSAKNRGLEISKGNYIQFLDADDILSPDKIENQLRLLNNQQDTICVCRTKIFYNLGDIKNKNLSEIDSDMLIYSDNPLKFLLNLNGLYGKVGMVQPNAYLVPRELVLKAGYWSLELSRSPDDDSEYFARILLNAKKIVYDSKSINYYRKSINTLSSSKDITNILGALKTLELKEKLFVKFVDNDAIITMFSNQYAEIAYRYGIINEKIIELVKMNILRLGLKKIPVTGGANFRLISCIVGFEKAINIKLKIVKFKNYIKLKLLLSFNFLIFLF